MYERGKRKEERRRAKLRRKTKRGGEKKIVRWNESQDPKVEEGL